jgi:hypothetical protein
MTDFPLKFTLISLSHVQLHTTRPMPGYRTDRSDADGATVNRQWRHEERAPPFLTPPLRGELVQRAGLSQSYIHLRPRTSRGLPLPAFPEPTRLRGLPLNLVLLAPALPSGSPSPPKPSTGHPTPLPFPVGWPPTLFSASPALPPTDCRLPPPISLDSPIQSPLVPDMNQAAVTFPQSPTNRALPLISHLLDTDLPSAPIARGTSPLTGRSRLGSRRPAADQCRKSPTPRRRFGLRRVLERRIRRRGRPSHRMCPPGGAMRSRPSFENSTSCST